MHLVDCRSPGRSRKSKLIESMAANFEKNGKGNFLGGIKVVKVLFFCSAKAYDTDNRKKTTLLRGLFKEL